MTPLKIAIVEEGKSPQDERVPFTPEQCRDIENKYSCEILVQKSAVRRIKDEAYLKAGIDVNEEIDDCDVFFGVKEIPVERLIPGKTFFFFSHTIKKQEYNRKLLQSVLEKGIRLIDYECLVDDKDLRLLGFGRFAGLVGTYNGLRMIGQKTGDFKLRKAIECTNLKDMIRELSKVHLPAIKICITGKGRVSGGVVEILEKLGIKRVGVDEYLHQPFDQAVYVQLAVTDYNKRKDGKPGEMFEFFKHPELYESDFMRFARVTDYYIASHFWDAKAPFIFTKEDLASDDFCIKYVADISCDIDGPVASTIRPSTIEEPYYGIDRATNSEMGFMNIEALAVMAVDNLPCELPVDASRDFGIQLMEHVVPYLFDDDSKGVLARATIAEKGKLTERFNYLKDFVQG
ncbi:MAG: NAD(P)-dependent oxidoreductase [Vicingaceae bacterium]